MISTNWAKNIEFSNTAENFFSPTSLQEIQQCILENSIIVARGTGHCFNRIADSKGAVISLHKMPVIYDLQAELGRVRVNGGLRYGDLALRLESDGYALQNMLSLPHTSIAGTVATGSHGSGVSNRNLSAAVVGLELILADGTLQSFSAESHPDIFDGLVISLGTLGVVYTVTLLIEPSYNISQFAFDNEIKRSEIASSFVEIMGSAYSVSYFTSWRDDGVNDMLLVKNRATTVLLEQALPPCLSQRTTAKDQVHMVRGFDPQCCTDQLGVSGPWLERLPHFKLGFNPSAGEELQSEFFIDMKDVSSALLALEDIAPRLSSVVFVTELRTIAPDTLWLSGAYERAAVGFHFTWKQIPEAYDMITEVERVLKPFNARPHWGKIFTPLSQSEWVLLYPRWVDFLKLRSEMDPTNKFLNGFSSVLFNTN